MFIESVSFVHAQDLAFFFKCYFLFFSQFFFFFFVFLFLNECFRGNMERYWMCGAAVLEIPQIARSVIIRRVDGQYDVKSGYIILDNREQV